MKLAIAALVVIAFATPARADEPTQATRNKAAALFEKAQAHYEGGRFSAAIPLFQEAYGLVHDPVYLFNLAQSYRKVLDCVAAADYYTRYLAAATDAGAKQRERVEGWLRELAPCVDERKRDAEAARAGQEAAERERIRQEGAPDRTTIDHGRWLRLTGYVAVGLGAVGIGLGVRYSIKGSNLADEIATQCDVSCDWADPALRDKNAAGKRANTISTTSWVGGGVALAGGVALYLIGRSRVEHVVVTPAEGGASVSARLAF